MKRIKSFEFRPGYGQGVETLDQQVNEFLRGLEKTGVSDAELKITHTDKVIVCTVIWEKRYKV